jgi:starvation-inducible DNA-binding protein
MAAPENPQANALDKELVDLLDLGLLAKHAHWNMVGPRFQAIHLLLDDLAQFARHSADRVAQRAVTLGHSPDGRAATIADLSSLSGLRRGELRDVQVIAAFVAILAIVADDLHSAVDAFEKDYVTVELLTSVLAEVERFAWMLRAQG